MHTKDYYTYYMDISFWIILLLVLFGFCLGLVATLGGIGGGVLMMPVFLLIFQMEPAIAKGTSLLVIFMSTSFATIIHKRNKLIHFPSILLIALFTITGSIFSIWIETLIKIDKRVFQMIFGVFIIIIALQLANKARNQHIIDKTKAKTAQISVKEHTQQEIAQFCEIGGCNLLQNRKIMIKSIPLFFIAGFIASFFGIGGGVINVPVLTGIYNLPIHFATAGSTGILAFTSLFNVISYGIQQSIDWTMGISIGIGAIIGARIGAKIAPRVPKVIIMGILIVLLIYAGLRLIFQF